jgi:hypothetical protein
MSSLSGKKNLFRQFRERGRSGTWRVQSDIVKRRVVHRDGETCLAMGGDQLGWYRDCNPDPGGLFAVGSCA